INIWTSLGPDHERINALAIDPLTPATLYAGTQYDGVFKSTDGGSSWHAVNTGLPSTFDGIEVEALPINPLTPTTLYDPASGGVFKSTDGGSSWHAAHTGISRAVVALAIDPTTPTTLYAGTLVSRLVGGHEGVLKSTDGGASWYAVNTGQPSDPDILALAIDPTTPTTLYTGTY